jgi:hypothetical protein
MRQHTFISFTCWSVCWTQQTSTHRTTRKTDKRMLPHSHDYHTKILSDFNKVQVTPWRWSVVIETCRSFLSVLNALIIDTKICVIIKKVYLLEHIKIVNSAWWNSEIQISIVVFAFIRYSWYYQHNGGVSTERYKCTYTRTNHVGINRESVGFNRL